MPVFDSGAVVCVVSCGCQWCSHCSTARIVYHFCVDLTCYSVYCHETEAFGMVFVRTICLSCQIQIAVASHLSPSVTVIVAW